jgi:hypothetical protein
MSAIQDKDYIVQLAADSAVALTPQPHEVYGRYSYLVPSSQSTLGIGLPRQNIALFDLKFGLPLLLFIALFIFIVSFRKSFSKLIVSFASFKKFWNYQRAQIWGELPFFALLFIFSIFPISLLCAEIFRVYLPSFSEENSFGLIFLYTCAAVGVLLLLRLLCYRLVGAIAKEKMLFNDMIYTQLIFFAVVGLAIVPTFLIKDFLDESIAENIMLPLMLFSLFVFCLYFFRTMRLFLRVKMPFLFWILYFCTLEILPLTVIFKLLENV